MAFGYHVDHQLVNKVGVKFLEEGYTVKFYSDFSYKVGCVEGFEKEDWFFSEKMLIQKVKACMCYSSQMPDLFGSNEKAERYFKNFKRGEWYYETYFVKQLSSNNGNN